MRILSSVLLFSLLVGVLAAPAAAEERVVNVALLNPAQIFNEADDIKGIRLNIIYGRNANFTGVDLGFIAGHATGTFSGVQWNWVNLVDGYMTGWQNGLFNQAKGGFLGFQSSAVNLVGADSEGVQLGFVNSAATMKGLQFGFVNITENMNGLQIGLLNIIKNKESLPVLPIVNWNF